ncbi:hypothetical protein N8K70_03005 [Microbacterium betulae]|uniref:Uncharacterized protein n=1 Tax=Microbacterium betulae TaxID=2981139 RepID=A0AA97FLK3_9MICO|nr:hypothetical protein [Microbacterium sp. AB]WOF23662.1 hypothetical protein N8K70_03005 [Microbacterium sp. AB]
MRDSLADVVESVRSQFFSHIDPELVQQIVEIEKQHVENRPRAQEGVARAIQHNLVGSAEA